MSGSLAARRRARALELHRARLSYAAVAASPDVEDGGRATLYSGPGRAYEAVQTAKRDEAQSIPELYYRRALEARELDLDTLDRLERDLAPIVAAGGLAGVKAAAVTVTVIERRARLLGLDHADGLDDRVTVYDRSAATRFAADVSAAITAAALSPEQEAAFRAHLHQLDAHRTSRTGQALALAATYRPDTATPTPAVVPAFRPPTDEPAGQPPARSGRAPARTDDDDLDPFDLTEDYAP